MCGARPFFWFVLFKAILGFDPSGVHSTTNIVPNNIIFGRVKTILSGTELDVCNTLVEQKPGWLLSK